MTDARHLTLHVDIDAFFASVEQRLIPSLRNRPVIVGSGCIASCSYEARAFGLHAGMSLREAKRLCPPATILVGDYAIYRCFAEHVWEVCRRYTCGLETYLDEAYGDVSGTPALQRLGPMGLVEEIRGRIGEEVGLPASAGLAANRMMAKLASSSAKPGGSAWIEPGCEEAFLDRLAVDKLLGVGRKTARKLRDMNVRTAGQLRRFSRAALRSMFGARGETLYERCRGCDERRIRPDGPPKTISRETTFHRSTCDPKEIRAMLSYLLERAMRAARELDLAAGGVELTIRYDDWRQRTARRTLAEPTSADHKAYAVVEEMLGRLHVRRVALRHVGVVLSKFVPAGGEATLFEPARQARRREMYRAVDAVRDRFGHAALVTGDSIHLLGRLEQNDYGFVLRTPSLTK